MSDTFSQDPSHMRRALDLSKRGLGKCSPNPLVGAVVINRYGDVVGTGYHQGPGTPHAEIIALSMAGEDALGGALYVTLEPCNHHGRTGPCVDAILEAKLSRVVVAMADPNPHVKGGGCVRLRESGVKVELGLMEDKAKELNRAYTKHITTGIPWFVLKIAMTVDGKTASTLGDSQWITSVNSRVQGHKLRLASGAILSGRGTLEKDDPRFSVRIPGRKEVWRPVVIADSRGTAPWSAQVFRVKERGSPTLWAVTSMALRDRLDVMRDLGVEIILCGDGPFTDLRTLASALGSRGINHVLVEAGGRLNASVIEQDLVDEMHVFVGPLLLGGEKAHTAMDGNGWNRVAEAPRFDLRRVRRMGNDVWMQYGRRPTLEEHQDPGRVQVKGVLGG